MRASGRTRRTGAALSEWEPPFQNRRIRTYTKSILHPLFVSRKSILNY